MRIFVLPYIVFWMACCPLSAATIVVDPNGAGDYTKIQPAIDAAANGDTVLVKSGEYDITEPVEFRGKGITLRGESGRQQTTIRMTWISETPQDGGRSVVVFEGGEGKEAVLEGFTMRGETESVGTIHVGHGESPQILSCTIAGNGHIGVDCVDASPIFRNCAVTGNYETGVVCRESGVPTFDNCTVWGSSTGLHCYDSTAPSLLNCTIAGCSTGLVCSSAATLKNCTITGNSGHGVGCRQNSAPILENCIIWDNASGSISFSDDCQLVVTYSCVEGNAVWPGGGNLNEDPLFAAWGDAPEVYVDPSAVEAGDGTRESPYCDLNAALDYGFSLARNSPCLGAGQGGVDMGADRGVCGTAGASERLIHLAPGRYRKWPLILAQRVSLLGSGRETILEGEIEGLRTGAALSDLKVEDWAPRGLGGFLSKTISITGEKAPEITRCHFVGDFITVSCSGTSVPTFTNCSFLNSGWVAISCYDESAPSFINCMILKDGVRCAHSSTPNFVNCTLAGEGRFDRFGIECRHSSTPVIKNCIIWNHKSSGSIQALDESNPQVSYSCIEGDQVWPGEGNINTDPLFVDSGFWDDNGTQGPDDTWDDVWFPGDYYLRPRSLCIDAGTPNGAPETDSVGISRPCGAEIDIGAYEYCGPGFKRGDCDSDGKFNVTDAICILRYAVSGGLSPSCLDAADVNDTGDIDLTDAVYLLGYLFLGGPSPGSPSKQCGTDPTVDDVSCLSFLSCE